MKELKEAIIELIKKVSGKQAFALLFVAILFAGAYFITDRIYDHIERADDYQKLKTYVMEMSRYTGYFYTTGE